MTLSEIRSINRAGAVWDAYQSRKRANDWAQWADAHPEDNEMLNTIMVQVNNGV